MSVQFQCANPRCTTGPVVRNRVGVWTHDDHSLLCSDGRTVARPWTDTDEAGAQGEYEHRRDSFLAAS